MHLSLSMSLSLSFCWSNVSKVKSFKDRSSKVLLLSLSFCWPGHVSFRPYHSDKFSQMTEVNSVMSDC